MALIEEETNVKTVTRAQAARILRQWVTFDVTDVRLLQMERQGIIALHEGLWTHYTPDHLFLARIAVTLQDFGLKYPRLTDYMELVAKHLTGRRNVTLTLKESGGAVLKIILPLAKFRREAEEAIADS